MSTFIYVPTNHTPVNTTAVVSTDNKVEHQNVGFGVSGLVGILIGLCIVISIYKFCQR